MQDFTVSTCRFVGFALLITGVVMGETELLQWGAIVLASYGALLVEQRLDRAGVR